VGEYDILFVGYPGPLDVYLARLLSWFRRKPLVWDILMSLYLITLERGLGKEHPVSVRLLRAIEKTACHLPDQLIIDTQEYVQWFVENYHIPAERFLLAPLGADDRFFQPLPHQPRDQPSFLVVYHGTFVPSHGVTTIIEAARLLQEDADILFELIGAGPELEIAQALAKAYRLENVTFSGWLEKERLVQELAQADVCLGTFGATRHSLLTIQNKIYESMAMAKPVITGDGPAIRRAFTDTEDGQRMPKHRQSEQVPGETCYAVERANPQALAQAIAHLKANPKLRQTLAQNGYNAFRQRYSIACLGAQLKEQLRGLSD
jgi:glycosyltransferase involved in cell wall biosynthesis